MNWKIWSLTIFGIIMGIISVYGIAGSNVVVYFILYWLVIAVISGVVIAKTADRLIFTCGVVVGLFDFIFCTLIQYLMFDTYLTNNAESVDGIKNLTSTLEPQFEILFIGPFAGIAYGLIIGLIAFMIDKSTGKNIKP